MRKSYPSLALLVALVSSGLAAAQPQQAPPPGAPTGSDADRGLPENQQAPSVVGFWYSHVESDNLSRTPAEIEGSYDGLGLLLGLERASTRFEASVNADLEYREYSIDELDNETVGTLNAAAEIDVIQDRFSWTFADDFGQGITDPFGGIGPSNRESINTLSTGPRVALPLGARMNLEMRGTYAERRFDESNTVDSDSVQTEFALYRQASTTARFGIVAGSNDVEYVDVLAPEYQIDRFALRYEKLLATGRVQADLGTNEISSAGLTEDEPFYNFLWTRDLATRSELSIRATRELTDAGGVLTGLVAPGPEGANFTDVLVTPNPLQQRRLGAAYVLTMSRTVVSAELTSWESEYIGNSLYDNDATTLHVSLVRTISPRLDFGIAYDDINRSFTNPQPDSDDSWVAVWVDRNFGRRMSLGLSISSYERGGAEEYDERRYEIRFGYSPTDSGAATMASVGR